MSTPPTPQQLDQRIRDAFANGELSNAEALLQTALRLYAPRPDLLGMLGQAAHARGDSALALASFDHALQLAPGAAVLLANRAAVRLATDDFDGAVEDARQATQAQPQLYGGWLNLGLALEQRGEYAGAADALQHACGLRPEQPIALRALARCSYRAGNAHRSSRPLLLQALQLAPDDTELGLMLASSYLNDAELAPALQVHSRLRQLQPQQPALASAELIALHYDPQTGPEALLRAHQDWARRFAAPRPAEIERRRSRGATLRVGWLSPRFAEGPLASLVLPALEALSTLGVEHHLYANHPPSGAAGQRFAEVGANLRMVAALSDAELIDQVRADRLDVIVDLAGHAPGNRMRALSERLAPLQVSWGDWFGTTGLPAMDAFFSDDFLTPPGSEAHFSERVLRLPLGRFCYRPSVLAPEPARRDGQTVVFVSFNRVAKMNDDVLQLWARILSACPEARLQLRAGAFDDAAARGFFLDRAERLGLPPRRLDLHGFCSAAEVMRAYAQADIALDPFPFNGCTTSADALWMGLPVITWPGRSLVSRQSGALLARLDLQSLIAVSADDYVERAVKLAEDSGGRAELRHSLRARMHERFDPAPFAETLKCAFIELLDR
jgi:protein O-GlcNAc transferase